MLTDDCRKGQYEVLTKCVGGGSFRPSDKKDIKRLDRATCRANDIVSITVGQVSNLPVVAK
jgi:hypothetical protein